MEERELDTIQKGNSSISAKEEKKSIIKYLFNLINPETVSFVIDQEVDLLSMMLTIAEKYTEIRIKHGLQDEHEDNILHRYIKNNFIVRFSMEGKRSEQAVKVAQQYVHEKDDSGIMSILGKKLLGTNND